MMRRLFALLLVAACLAVPLGTRAADPAPIPGFAPASSEAERALERAYDANIASPALLRTWLHRLSLRPHHVGSPYDAANADYLRGMMASFGFDAKIETFDVLFATPKSRLLELTAPRHFRASLMEAPVPGDPNGAQTAEQLPPYNAYSIDGDVTAPLVYVNYGLPRDYDELARRGIDVRGKIVIARYGQSWRGIKPKVAAEHGAVGCLIYSDPRDDGYGKGDAYPVGPYRNATMVQRGSVADNPLYPGDPLSLGVGAATAATRPKFATLADRKKIPVLTKIPTLPISYADATPLLRALGGPVAPASWRGGLPFTYHLGGGTGTRAHLALAFDWKLATLHDVISVMKGVSEPDVWVVRGNHHDAWVNGAEDPLSGAISELAEARAVGMLAKTGYRPKRTLVYCFWDGEEPGLLGSTAWTETHAAELKQKVAIYINTDGYERGFLSAQGSHSLESTYAAIAGDVTDPETHVTVARRALAAAAIASPEPEAMPTDGKLHLAAAGSGSDFASFLDYLTVPTVNVDYGGEGGGDGAYHSVYDSFDNFTRFQDPGFTYGQTMAKTAGRFTLRFANADLLPYAFAPLAATVARYDAELKKAVAAMRKADSLKNQRLADGTFAALVDPRDPVAVPTAAPAMAELDFSALDTAIATLTTRAAAYDAASAARLGKPAAVDPASDAAIMKVEAAFAMPAGLPRRAWYKHALYAPGFYTGYGVKTMPKIREAVEQRNWAEAQTGIASVAAAISRAAAAIQAATPATTAVRP
jgi:N-acetylated-alpha-linked acidic dipeptidase